MEPNQASTVQVAMVTLLVSFPKEDSFFQPRSSAWAATILCTLGTRLPSPITSALCHGGRLVERGSVLSHDPVSAGSVFWLEGEQEGKAPEMRPQFRHGHWGSLPLHLLLPPDLYPLLSPDRFLFS